MAKKRKSNVITCVVDFSKLGPDEVVDEILDGLGVPKPAIKLVKVDPLSLPLVIQPKYKVLHLDDKREVRLYPPCKRTMAINNRQYYLPLPHLIFNRLFTPPKRAHSNWNKNAYNEGITNLFMGFTTAEAKKVYHIPLHGVSGFCVCLDSHYHYDFPGQSTFEELIRTFWTTNFAGDLEGMARYSGTKVFGGRFHEWAKMTLEQLEQELPKLETIGFGRSLSFDDFKKIQRIY